MTSLSSQRIGNSITWSLSWMTRSRTIALSFSSTERMRSRFRRQHEHYVPNSRRFSTQSFHYQQAAQPTPSRPFPTSRPVNTPATSTSSTANPITREPPPPTARSTSTPSPPDPIVDITTTGLSDKPSISAGTVTAQEDQVDWTRSFHGLSTAPFPPETSAVLLEPIAANDIEVKPDGLIYLPEIKYRRILNRAFGPGGWGLAPRGETIVTAKSVTREYALVAQGRLVSIARGEQDYFDAEGVPTATEGCKSNALMRCCKDLGIASELWDPRYIRKFLAQNAKEVWVEHAVTKKRRKVSMRKDDEVVYPYREAKMTSASGQV